MSVKRCRCPRGLPYVTENVGGDPLITTVTHADFECPIATVRLSSWGKTTEHFAAIVEYHMGKKAPLDRIREGGR